MLLILDDFSSTEESVRGSDGKLLRHGNVEEKSAIAKRNVYDVSQQYIYDVLVFMKHKKLFSELLNTF